LPYRASAPGTRVYTYTELVAADFPAPSPIAKDFLHEGETIGLVGKPKQGKSRLVQQFAIDVSRGRSFLGHEVPKASRVLILDFENRPAVAKQRLLKMDGKPITDNLLVYAPESLMANAITIASEDGVKALVQVVKDVMPDVLIVDNWRLFLAGDENKTDVVLHGLKVLSALRSIVRTLGIIIVHHIRKQQQGEKQVSLRVDPSAWIESASGHYAFVAHVDACFGLERENTGDGNELIIFAGVARNTAPRTLLLDEDEQTLRFRVAEGSDVERLFTPKELEFWRAIRKLDEFSFTDVVNATGTTNRKAVSSMLRKANNMNLVEKRDQLYRRIIH
jgi:AAA domain